MGDTKIQLVLEDDLLVLTEKVATELGITKFQLIEESLLLCFGRLDFLAQGDNPKKND